MSKYCCSECGGTNIQVQAWINPNTGQIVDTLESNDCWCEDCEDRTKLKQKGNYNKVYALALLYLCKKYREGI